MDLKNFKVFDKLEPTIKTSCQLNNYKKLCSHDEYLNYNGIQVNKKSQLVTQRCIKVSSHFCLVLSMFFTALDTRIEGEKCIPLSHARLEAKFVQEPCDNLISQR